MMERTELNQTTSDIPQDSPGYRNPPCAFCTRTRVILVVAAMVSIGIAAAALFQNLGSYQRLDNVTSECNYRISEANRIISQCQAQSRPAGPGELPWWNSSYNTTTPLSVVSGR